MKKQDMCVYGDGQSLIKCGTVLTQLFSRASTEGANEFKAVCHFSMRHKVVKVHQCHQL